MLELLNGEACAVNRDFMDDVIAELDQVLERKHGRKAKVLVISICGVQSSGKSTLINTMFGCDMRTSVGTCTRGVNMALLSTDGQWLFEFGERPDYTLILDSEGTCNPLNKHETWDAWHNNRLTTFCMLAADVCILLNNNEDHTFMQSVLPQVMIVKQALDPFLRQLGMTRCNVVVYNRIDAEQAKSKLKTVREALIDSVEAQWRELVQERGAGAKNSGFQITKEDFHYCSHMRHVTEASYEDYGMQVEGIRCRIQKALNESRFKAADLNQWYKVVESVSECLDSFSFEQSFSSLVRLKLELSCRKMMRDCYHVIATICSKHQEATEAQLHSGQAIPTVQDMLGKLKSDIEKDIRKSNVRDKVAKFLQNPQYSSLQEEEQRNFEKYITASIDEATSNVSQAYKAEVEVKQVEGKGMEDIMTEVKAKLKDPILGPCLRRQDQQGADKRRQVFDEAFDKKLKSLATNDLAAHIDIPARVRDKWPRQLVLQTDVGAKQQGQHLLSFLNDAGHFVVNVWRKISYQQSLERDKEDQLKELAERAAACLDKVRKHKGPFSEKCVEEAAKAAQILFDSQTLQVTDSEKKRFTMHIMMKTGEILAKADKEWQQQNSPLCKVKAQRPKLLARFEALCAGVLSIHAFGQKIGNDVIEAAKDYMRAQTLRRTSSCLSQVPAATEAQVLFAAINLDLLDQLEADEEKGLDLLMYNSKSHHKHVLWSKIQLKVPSPATMKADCLKATTYALDAMKLVVFSQAPLTDEAEFVKAGKDLPHLLNKFLPSTLWSQISDFFTDGPEMQDSEVQELFDGIISTVKSNWPEAPSINDVDDILQDMSAVAKEVADAAKPRCSARCPMCKMQCMEAESHDGQHNCLHQPDGLAGVHYVHSKELCVRTCTEHVEHGDTFYPDADHSKPAIPYADFSKQYLTWKKPSAKYPQEMMANYEARLYIFAKYQHKIAQRLNLKPCPNVPTPESLDVLKGKLQKILEDADKEVSGAQNQ